MSKSSASSFEVKSRAKYVPIFIALSAVGILGFVVFLVANWHFYVEMADISDGARIAVYFILAGLALIGLIGFVWSYSGRMFLSDSALDKKRAILQRNSDSAELTQKAKSIAVNSQASKVKRRK